MITTDKLKQIEAVSKEAVNYINNAVDWVNFYEKDEKRFKSLFELKTQRIELNRLNNVLVKKPVIAMFGASQVGKSYMANNLLYDSNNRLLVDNHQDNSQIDFLKDINPLGEGKEATGAVTRFISEKETDPKRYPVKISVMKIADIICILSDTYFNDLELDSKLPDKSQIEEIINLVSTFKKGNKQSFLNDDDVYIIKEYIEKRCLPGPHSFKLDLEATKYWNYIAENIADIDIDFWDSVFSVLWNNKSEISEVFSLSIEFLQNIKFESTLYVNFDLIKHRNGGSLINVISFNEFFSRNSETCVVQTKSFDIINVDFSKLGYHTTEITLRVSEGTLSNRKFVKDVDILDFPGARPREKFKKLDNKNNLLEMMRRGKVAYLFNNYSRTYQSNILIVCQFIKFANVPELPYIIKDWINDNLGETPEVRSKNITQSIPPFFLVITWWNTQLEELNVNNVIEDRLTGVFKRTLDSDIFKEATWNKSWKINNEEFSNIYLLRDFEKSKVIYKQPESISMSIEEASISQTQSVFMEDFKKGFLKFHNNKVFFKDPEKSFNEASLPGKDGSEWIIENLSKIANNTYSTPIYLNKIISSLDKIKMIISEKYHSDNQDEVIRRNAKDGAALQLNMDIVFGNNAFLFGDFIEKLLVTEAEILEFYHELLKSDKLIKKKDTNKYIMLRVQNPDIKPEPIHTFEKNLEILRKHYRHESDDETKEYFAKENIDLNELFNGDLYNLQNNSIILADEAQRFWFENKLDIKNFKSLTDQNINKELLENALDVFKRLFSNLEINKIIASHIREYVDVQQKIDKAEDMIAHITAGLINKFVNSSGWSFFSISKKNEIEETNLKNNLKLNLPDNNKKFQSIVRSDDNQSVITLEKLLDFMDKLNENLNKKPIDVSIAKYVPMILNYQQWINLVKAAFVAVCEIPNYDVEGNRKIGGIIENINKLEIPSLEIKLAD
jgi:hypothetical protein